MPDLSGSLRLPAPSPAPCHALSRRHITPIAKGDALPCQASRGSAVLLGLDIDLDLDLVTDGGHEGIQVEIGPPDLGLGAEANGFGLCHRVQTGAVEFRVADLVRDAALLPVVHELGERLRAHHAEAARRIVARWVGGAARYAGA